MLKELLPAFRITLALSVLTGLVYPGIVTALSQLLFPNQANGSIVSRDGEPAGSSLIGQNFTRPEYFYPRPSAAGAGYDGAASGGSNLGPASQKLFERVKSAEEQFRHENPDFNGPIPADALTASGSGLDPHISPATARTQLARVAAFRSADPAQIQQVIDRFTERRTFGFLGEPRVNVLLLNMALDDQFPSAR